MLPFIGARVCVTGAHASAQATFLHCSRRAMTYSTFDAMSRGRRRHQVKTPRREDDSAAVTSAPSASGDASPLKRGLRRREGDSKVGAGQSSSPANAFFTTASGRPLQSSVQAKKEAQMVFPRTLKSGRTKEHNTVSQQLYMSKPQHAEEFAQQQQRDREYTEQMKALHARRHDKVGSGADSRFFSAFTDYRDIQETDPYAKIFGETGTTQRLRTSAWQRQFEKENEHVELPYERTNVLARIAPNWFVRYFVNMRDKGGADHLHFLWAMGAAAGSLLWLVGYLFYTAPSRAKPISEVR